MTPASPTNSLADAALQFTLPEESVQENQRLIHHDLLAQSKYIRAANFTTIHPRDLEFLFDAYDRRFLHGLCRTTLAGRALRFHLSPRMPKSGGATKRLRLATGEVRYEIAIASSMLFDGFRPDDRQITVCGLECRNRLEALQRIFEHELVHLIENLCWNASNCSAPRFQDVARRLFLHRAHTHRLITRRERAAESGIRPGSRVAFVFEGQRLTGRVNRITQRATVLVEDPGGRRYSDGLHY
jgi:hypothetical protein